MAHAQLIRHMNLDSSVPSARLVAEVQRDILVFVEDGEEVPSEPGSAWGEIDSDQEDALGRPNIGPSSASNRLVTEEQMDSLADHLSQC